MTAKQLRRACIAATLPWVIGLGIWAGINHHSYFAAAATVIVVWGVLYIADQ